MTANIHKVEAEVALELPGDRMVKAYFIARSNGDITVQFEDDELAQAIISEAIQNRLVFLGFHYAAARPKENT